MSGIEEDCDQNEDERIKLLWFQSDRDDARFYIMQIDY